MEQGFPERIRRDIRMDAVIIEKKNMILHGRKVWLTLKNKNVIDNSWVLILFPTRNTELNESAIKCIPAYLDRKYLANTMLLAIEGTGLFKDIKINGHLVVTKYLSESDMESILTFYKLQQFFKNIVVVSLEDPFSGGGIIGKCGITLDDYVADAIFV